MPFPLFPDLLKELMSSGKDRPYSGRSAIPGVSSLNCDADVNVGTTCGHPSAPLAVCALLPQPGLPLQGEQSVLSERAYGAAALNALILTPSPIFGTVLGTMQHRYKAKKKENEALQLCLLQMPVARCSTTVPA